MSQKTNQIPKKLLQKTEEPDQGFREAAKAIMVSLNDAMQAKIESASSDAEIRSVIKGYHVGCQAMVYYLRSLHTDQPHLMPDTDFN
jgi:hypothetical protein